jgi:hypothetical protein
MILWRSGVTGGLENAITARCCRKNTATGLSGKVADEMLTNIMLTNNSCNPFLSLNKKSWSDQLFFAPFPGGVVTSTL